MLLRNYKHFIQIKNNQNTQFGKKNSDDIYEPILNIYPVPKNVRLILCVCVHCTVYEHYAFCDSAWYTQFTVHCTVQCKVNISFGMVIGHYTNSTGQPEMSGRLIHVYVFLRDARHLSVKGIFRDKHLMYSQVHIHTCKIN